jgi:hypothetical protein
MYKGAAMQRSYDDPSNQYQDFELDVGQGVVRVLNSPVGQARAPFKPPFGPEEQEALRRWLEQAVHTREIGRPSSSASISLETPERIGEKLFRSLFTGNVHTCYEKSRSYAEAQGWGGLRIKLRLAEELERLPWELLYDPQDDYLALTPDLTLVRYLEAPMPQTPLEVDLPLRVLIVAGAPEGLDLDDEINGIVEATADLVAQNRLHIDVLKDASVDKIYERLFLGQKQRRQIHVVHFLGHGDAPSAGAPARLLLHNEEGRPMPIEIGQIWRMLRRIESLRLIWLNSCSGAVGKEGALYGPLASAAARFVAAGLPAVLANQLRISDNVARKLARTFYTSLAEGSPIDVALSEARFRVSWTERNSLEWATPVIYMRAPDGVLFRTPEAAPAPQGAQQRGPSGSSDVPAASQTPAASEDQQFLRELLAERKRRLYQRQLQQARYGISADPSIVIEIEDLTREIAQLEARLGRPA